MGERNRHCWWAPRRKATRSFGFGQANVWFAEEESAENYIQKVVESRRHLSLIPLLLSSIRRKVKPPDSIRIRWFLSIPADEAHQDTETSVFPLGLRSCVPQNMPGCTCTRGTPRGHWYPPRYDRRCGIPTCIRRPFRRPAAFRRS